MHPEPDALLAQPVATGGAAKPFGEWTVEEVGARAAELKQSASVGPPIAAVARAWGQLARRMETDGAATVTDVDRAALGELEKGLRVLPPEGGLLR